MPQGLFFLVDETAAVSAEWVVLLALVCGLGLLVVVWLDSGLRLSADHVGSRLSIVAQAIDE